MIKDAPIIFPARVISIAAGVSKKTVHRRAGRKEWPQFRRGNRLDYKVPSHLRRACREISPVPQIIDQKRILRELLRAAAVAAFIIEMKRRPQRGSQRTLIVVADNFRHLTKFSPAVLRRWVAAVENGGLAALEEHRVGVIGRKPKRLEGIL